MTLLDAYAVVAFLIGGPAAPQVRSILREGDSGIATVNLAEALDVSNRVGGLPIGRAFELLEPLFESSLAPIGLDPFVASRAAEVRGAHYHHSRQPLSLADSVLIATAAPGDRIATADPHLLTVASTEGIDTVPLPGQG